MRLRLGRVIATMAPGVGVAVVAVAIAAFYLATYGVHHFTTPLGWDSPGYAWRTNFVRAFGVANLPATIPNPGPVNPGRPGFVAIAALAASIGRTDTVTITAVLPAVMAAVTGLGTGALVGTVLHRPQRDVVFVAAFTGMSVFVVHLINVEAYQDAAMAAGVLTAGFAAAVLATRHRRALPGAVVLLGAAGLIHWDVFLVGLCVLALTAVAAGPASVQAWREGARIVATPSAVVLTAAVGGAAVALGAILVVLTAGLPTPRLDGPQFLSKIGRDLPSYHVPILLAAATAGAVVLARRGSAEGDDGARHRSLLFLLLAWCQVTILFFVAGWFLSQPVPTHRVLAMCLALPVLAALALLALTGSARPARRAAGALLALAALAASAAAAQAAWLGFHPVVRPAQVQQARDAAAYLDDAGIPIGRPVVFVTDDRTTFAWSRTWLAAPVLRAALPPARTTSLYVYVGTPEDYLARRPTVLPPGTAASPGEVDPSVYDSLTGTYFAAMRGTYGRNPLAIILSSVNPGYLDWAAHHPDAVVAPGVAVVRGPPPTPAAAAAPPGRLSFPVLAILAMVILAALWVIGAGWTAVLFDPGSGLRPVERAALAPAVGTAITVIGGVLLNRVGIPLRGTGAWTIALVLALGGWALAWNGSRTRPVVRRGSASGAGVQRASSTGVTSSVRMRPSR